MTTAGKDNLTRDEARERARVVRAPAYDVKLDLTDEGESFRCESTVTFEGGAGASTFVDLDADEVAQIELNGAEVALDRFADGRVRLDGLEATNTLRIVADMAYSRTGTGLHRFTDPVDDNPYAYTQFEPFDAHRVFPCFDQPDIKGTFTFDVTVPEGFVVISNTRPTTSATNGATRWAFETSPVMSTYLAAICAGPFHGVHDKIDGGIDLGWYCRRSLAPYLDPDELFEITKQGFAFFQEIFDYPYMLGTYDQVFCPEYKFGAMENLGCVTYTEHFVFRSKVTEAEREHRAEVILHEMSHMWFGDLVTMRWWDDLWLNESFATYMAYLAKERATRFENSWVSFCGDEKRWAYAQDQLPTTHPIVADIPDVEATHLNFDGITYAKGASVVKQLVAWVGQDAFFRGLRRYFKTHEWGNTELADFLRPLAEESGRDLEAWSAEWLETAGVNSVRVEITEDGDRVASAAVVQEPSNAQPTLRSHRLALGLFDATASGLELRRALELDVVGERTEVADLAGERVPDLLLPNHLDLAYTKIRFDERSLRTLTGRLRDLPDTLARTLCWSAAWDMVRDAELPARRYAELVMNNVSGETDIGVVSDLLNLTTGALYVYGNPANRDALRSTLAAHARETFLSSDPASDLQLTWARAFVRWAWSDDEVCFVRAILDGDEEVPGLAVDTEFRWHVVKSLAAKGRVGDDVISAELERDPTDQGERHAASARAARPDAEAKADAWRTITEDANVTLAMLRSLIQGFQAADQEEHLEPYAGRYFAELLPYWERRDLDLGLAFTGGMYPNLSDEAVVRATDAFLARGDVPPPVRRLLLEGKDGAERAMRARRADAALQ